MSEHLRFDGRAAIVTGAGGALGRAYALSLAKRGCKVLVNDLGTSLKGQGASSEAADALVQEIRDFGGEAVADYHSVVEGDKIVEACVATFGRVDVVINNAGILRDVSFKRMSQSDWDLVLQVHLAGAHRVTRAAWPHMLKHGFGRIIMISSVAGLYGSRGQANYSSAKLGQMGLSKSLAIEGKKHNIRCNVVAPLAGSRMLETVMPKQIVQALRPDLVAPLVTFLVHESCQETGSTFEVGGGWVAKLRWERSRGVTFSSSDAESPLTADSIQQRFEDICDFSTGATHPKTAQDTFAVIMSHLNNKPRSAL